MKQQKTAIKTRTEPQPFEYLGKTFKPVITGERYNWNKLASKSWGNKESLQPLDWINKNGYTWEGFYKAAKAAGCGKIDVFEMDGEKVIPCNELQYYGEPKWYAKKHAAELHEQTFRRYSREYLKDALRDIETALTEKMEKAFESGAIPEQWKETGNHLLVKAVCDSFCKDRPYAMNDKRRQKEADNLHLFI